MDADSEPFDPTRPEPGVFDPERVDSFRYLGYEVDEATHTLRCEYALDDLHFVETAQFDDGTWTPAAYEAARIVFLVSGISYYKAAAPPTIDLGDTPVHSGDIDFLRNYYRDGLGEYAYRNDVDLSGLKIIGGIPTDPLVSYQPRPGRPLAPFGGGIDSIVTLNLLRAAGHNLSLFVVSRAGDSFDAIEGGLAVADLLVRRAARELDPEILRSAEHGYRNGHIPVTAIISALAVLSAVLDARDAVVMSNEASASSGNVTVDGHEINHQWSKSLAFEREFRSVLAAGLGEHFQYFSLLRPASELWIARHFATLKQFHRAFRSCNRAFHLDPARRATEWCGECDKCCFIDLILAPFLSAPQLNAIFGGREPLNDGARLEQFETLIGVTENLKPFECVGDVDECRAAVVLSADRLDRAGNALLERLEAQVGVLNAKRLLQPSGPHHIPDAYAPRDFVR